jgi:hypothetical protein
MPTISMFFGIIIRMYFMGRYATTSRAIPACGVSGMLSVISLPDGELLEGPLPAKKLRLVQAWVAIHEEELMPDWALAVKG